jgi:aryl-alcohol dehydrogenase-like predicted oxidoreductase
MAEAYRPFRTEEPIGKALAPIRDRVVIATKFLDRAVSWLRANSNKGYTT